MMGWRLREGGSEREGGREGGTEGGRRERGREEACTCKVTHFTYMPEKTNTTITAAVLDEIQTSFLDQHCIHVHVQCTCTSSYVIYSQSLPLQCCPEMGLVCEGLSSSPTLCAAGGSTAVVATRCRFIT